jgi:hypothetical protein
LKSLIEKHRAAKQSRLLLALPTGAGKDHTIAEVYAVPHAELTPRRATHEPHLTIAAATVAACKRKVADMRAQGVTMRLPVYASRAALGCVRAQAGGDLAREVKAGYTVDHACPSCPHAPGCEAKTGVWDDGKGTTDGHITLRTHAHVLHQRDPPANLVWDEAFPFFSDRVVSRRALENVCNARGEFAAALAPTARFVLQLMDLCDRPESGFPKYSHFASWHKLAQRLQFVPDLEAIESARAASGWAGAPSKRPLWPVALWGALAAVARNCHGGNEAVAIRRGVSKDYLHWYEDHRRALSGAKVLVTDATGYLEADKYRALGFRIEQHRDLGLGNQHRVFWPCRDATRGKLVSRGKMTPTGAEALRRVLGSTYRALGSEGRVLLVLYKVLVGSFDPPPWCAVRHYHELASGTNDFAEYDAVVCFGDPNPNVSGRAWAEGRFWGPSKAPLMAREADRLLVQAEGRLRANRRRKQVFSVVVAPKVPHHWEHDGFEVRWDLDPA